MKTPFIFIFVCALLSCNDHEQVRATETATGTGPGEKCFAYYKNRDSVFLSIQFKGSGVTGTMLYSIYEKDRNNGTFKGELHGDTLLGDYIFQSEGTQSSREVAFLLKGNTLTEGFGPVTESNGGMRFSDTAGLQFSGFVLGEVPCSDTSAAASR